MNFHHLGIATNNIGKSLSFVKNTFEVISYTDTIYDPKQDVELVLIVTKSVNLEPSSVIFLTNLISFNLDKNEL